MFFSPQRKMSVSLFYDALRSFSTVNAQRVKRVWEKELSVTIDKEMCEDIWRYAKTISIFNRTRAIQLRIIHRLHISPNHRHAFNTSSSSPQCLKCKTDTGSLTHCLWSCSKLQRYWSSVLQEIEFQLSIQNWTQFFYCQVSLVGMLLLWVKGGFTTSLPSQ